MINVYFINQLKKINTMRKYKLIDPEGFDRKYKGIPMKRLIALKNFSDVKKGDLGGLIDESSTLSQDGDCWIYSGSVVIRDSKIDGNAKVRSSSKIESSTIKENTDVKGVIQYSEICGHTFIDVNHSYILRSVLDGNIKIIGTSIKIEDSKIIDSVTISSNEFSRMEIFNSDIKDNVTIRNGRLAIYYSKLQDNCKIEGESLYCIRLQDLAIRISTAILGSDISNDAVIDGESQIYRSSISGKSIVQRSNIKDSKLNNVTVENSKIIHSSEVANMKLINSGYLFRNNIEVNNGGSITMCENHGNITISL